MNAWLFSPEFSHWLNHAFVGYTDLRYQESADAIAMLLSGGEL
jgi:hypothetical protein